MECIWKIKCILPKDIDKEEMKKHICQKIARIIISQEKQFYTIQNN